MKLSVAFIMELALYGKKKLFKRGLTHLQSESDVPLLSQLLVDHGLLAATEQQKLLVEAVRALKRQRVYLVQIYNTSFLRAITY